MYSSLNVPVHLIVVYYNVMHIVTLYCTALDCTALDCTALHRTELYWTEIKCMVQYCTALHCTARYCTALNCTALNCTALQCTALYYTGIKWTAGPKLHMIDVQSSVKGTRGDMKRSGTNKKRDSTKTLNIGLGIIKLDTISGYVQLNSIHSNVHQFSWC